jgi:hypothetical protein
VGCALGDRLVMRRVGLVRRRLCAGFALPLLTFCAALPGGLDSAAPSGASVQPFGNDRYPQGHALHLAGADARAMAESFRARGFELVGGSAHIDTST